MHYIKWQNFRELNSLQEKVGLTFKNKLSSKHIAWTKNKMKVKLAAQTLSSSVAAAFEFLREDMNVSEFQGSEGTSIFVQKIDVAFVILNSSNPFAKGSKAPVNTQSLPTGREISTELCEYIFSLKDTQGGLLCNSPRKIAI